MGTNNVDMPYSIKRVRVLLFILRAKSHVSNFIQFWSKLIVYYSGTLSQISVEKQSLSQMERMQRYMFGFCARHLFCFYNNRLAVLVYGDSDYFWDTCIFIYCTEYITYVHNRLAQCWPHSPAIQRWHPVHWTPQLGYLMISWSKII